MTEYKDLDVDVKWNGFTLERQKELAEKAIEQGYVYIVEPTLYGDDLIFEVVKKEIDCKSYHKRYHYLLTTKEHEAIPVSDYKYDQFFLNKANAIKSCIEYYRNASEMAKSRMEYLTKKYWDYISKEGGSDD